MYTPASHAPRKWRGTQCISRSKRIVAYQQCVGNSGIYRRSLALRRESAYTPGYLSPRASQVSKHADADNRNVHICGLSTASSGFRAQRSLQMKPAENTQCRTGRYAGGHPYHPQHLCLRPLHPPGNCPAHLSLTGRPSATDNALIRHCRDINRITWPGAGTLLHSRIEQGYIHGGIRRSGRRRLCTELEIANPM